WAASRTLSGSAGSSRLNAQVLPLPVPRPPSPAGGSDEAGGPEGGAGGSSPREGQAPVPAGPSSVTGLNIAVDSVAAEARRRSSARWAASRTLSGSAGSSRLNAQVLPLPVPRPPSPAGGSGGAGRPAGGAGGPPCSDGQPPVSADGGGKSWNAWPVGCSGPLRPTGPSGSASGRPPSGSGPSGFCGPLGPGPSGSDPGSGPEDGASEGRPNDGRPPE